MKTRRKLVVHLLLVLIVFSPLFRGTRVDADSDGGSLVRYNLSVGGINRSIAVTNGSSLPMILLWDDDTSQEKLLLTFEALFEGLVVENISSLVGSEDRIIGIDNLFEQIELSQDNSSEQLSQRNISEKLRQIWEELEIPIAARYAYFDFMGSTWMVRSIKSLNATDGTLIGIAVEYVPTDIEDPEFRYLARDMVLRLRLHLRNVTVASEDWEYGVGTGEVEVELAIERWRWFVDRHDIPSAVARDFDLELKSQLIGKMKARFLNTTDVLEFASTPLPDLLQTSTLHLARARKWSGENHFTSMPLGQETLLNDVESGVSPDRLGVEMESNRETAKGYVRLSGICRMPLLDGSQTVGVDVLAAYSNDSVDIYIRNPYLRQIELRHGSIVGITRVGGSMHPPEPGSRGYSMSREASTWKIFSTDRLSRGFVPVDVPLLVAVSILALAVVAFVKRIKRLEIESGT
jgi:hypothetical protein